VAVSITAISGEACGMGHRLDRVVGPDPALESSGLILSNAPVVFGRQILTVPLDSRVTLSDRFVGADLVFDVALVRARR
jgi:S1-C subfamily serine protease